jgi:class 3 adenylate cyclase
MVARHVDSWDPRHVSAALELVTGSPTIEELLRSHPWPREFADARRLEWLWTVDVPAAPSVLWPVLADLSRLNRALGLPLMTFVEKEGIRWGSARYTGVKHEWQEVPWNWVANRWYELVRIYRKGSMRALHGICELQPTAAGTRISIYYGVVPRSRIFDLGLKFSFGAMGRAYKRLLPQVAEDVKREPANPQCLRAPAAKLRPETVTRLDTLAESLIGEDLDPKLVRQLVDWIASATDEELERIRVRERARVWSIDEDELLRVFLHATRTGLLDLTWDVVCPHCRGVRDTTGQLDTLPTSGQCEACGIAFGTDSPDAVEITFHAHSSIRPVERGMYCSAEPVHKPHIHVQHALAPGESATLAVPVGPGKYRMRVRGEMRGGWLEIVDGAPSTLAWSAAAVPEHATLAPGGTLELANVGDKPCTFVVETAVWLELALRPGRLLSFQEFRDLFSDQYLGTNVQLAVGEQTILFTDLVGSTAMYAERGDPAAFVEVKKHFEHVFAIIGKHRGAVVKTIGDAVMGAFNEPLDAVKAARAIHEAFPPSPLPTALRLRVSLNSGTCIAVRLNSAIDYFGHAVNLAAKLQALAESWQIAMSETTATAHGVAEWLVSQGAELDELTIQLKGIDEPVRARRWTLYREI